VGYALGMMSNTQATNQKWSQLNCDQVAECFSGILPETYRELWSCEEGEEDAMPTISEKWGKLSEEAQRNVAEVLKNYPECYFGDNYRS
jgi:hypothetical protein